MAIYHDYQMGRLLLFRDRESGKTHFGILIAVCIAKNGIRILSLQSQVELVTLSLKAKGT